MSLFDEIRAGKALRKVPESEKKDRSTLDGMKKVAGAPAAPPVADPARSGNPTPAPPAGLGGLFANGVPKLRPGGMRASGPDTGTRAIPTPPQPASQPNPPPAAAATAVASMRAPTPRAAGTAPPAPPRASVPPPPPPPPPSSASMPGPPSRATVPAPYTRPSAVGTATPALSNGSSVGRPMLRQRMGEPTAPKPKAPMPPGMGGSAPFRPATATNAAPPPPPPPPQVIDRRDSGINRSQRVGLPSNEDNAPRPANAKPKVIHINARGAPAPPPPPPPPPPQQSNAMYGGPPQRSHPPAPLPPAAESNLATEFERRFRFLNEQQLPAPPIPYHGQRTYKSKQNRAVPHPTINAPNGPSYP